MQVLNERGGMARPAGLTLVFLVVGAGTLAAQVKPDQAADMLLGSARRAYNEKNYAFAADRYRDFLGRYGGHKEVTAARYELALALLHGPDKNYAGATDELQKIAGDNNFPDHALVLYYLGLAQRGLGTRELAAAKPPEAQKRFDEAASQFAAALAALAAKAKPPPAGVKELPLDQEWVARARNDLAEMQLRTGKLKEALATAEPFVKDPLLARSRYHGLGLYYHGFAAFLLKDYLTAGRSLNRLTPFTDPVFGTHARYLVAQIHHLADERKEAADHYEAVLADHAKLKQAAAQALQRPETFKNDPEEKARLEALTRDPPPDHVARATFYVAVLLYEDGRFADALARFEEFSRLNPKSPLLADVQLRQGFCRVQLKQYADAIRLLQPLADSPPGLADQALYWIGKAQVGGADPNNAPAYDQALKTAIDTFRRAADKAQQQAGAEPEARGRRGDILLELADTQQLIHQHREAAATYQQILNKKILPERDEELLVRLAAAWHLAGEYNESDKVCQSFQQTYPKSTLLPAVLFRHAENAYFTALAAEKNPNLPNRAPELARLYDEAGKRYQVVIDRFPEFTYVHLARYGLALATYHKGDVEKARQLLAAIPPTERHGDLAQVPYLLAHCLIRLAPAKADDALAAGKMEEQLKAAADLLDGFIAAQPNDPKANDPQTPDALLKLGLCHQRLATLNAQPAERAKSLGNARAAYENLIQRFAQHPLQPQAVFERARCLAQAGDKQTALNELQRFAGDPLKAASIAPMAYLEWSLLLRDQHKPQDAANVLAQCRQQYEGTLNGDKERAAWVPVLQYHHGMALKEAGKLAEARALFEQITRQFATRPEAAEAALRWGQCQNEEGLAKIDAARKAQAAATKPEEQAAAARTRDEGLRFVGEGVKYLENQAEQLKPKAEAAEIRARTLYETAWGYRTLAEFEVAAARDKLQQERLKKLQEEADKEAAAAGRPAGKVAPPDIPLTAIPLQPAEQKARAQYQALIAAAADLPLANNARLELAELFTERGELDPAIPLLTEALDKEPPAELADRVRLRLGACHAAKKNYKAALAQFDVVAQNPKSLLVGEAHYRAGECLLQQGEAAEAVKHLVLFRDQPPFQNLPGLRDRALLRLGHAYAHLKQWNESRQALETLLGRFGNSSWIHEARYGIGWAWQNQGQFDNAVNAYAQVTTGTVTEVAAKAQLQIGLCRLEQKRPADAAKDLLLVPYTYDYPEWNAVALCEAARALTELKQPRHAEKLLRRVLRDYPDSKWSQIAKDRLEELKKG
jgi:tetratricopeptide (TPR) repeat protein